MNLTILIILILTALVCVFPGIIILEKKLAMTTDAISHSILLGMVVGFFIANTIDSIYLFVGAIIVAFLTIYLINKITYSKKIGHDSATILIYSLFFSLAIILITMFANNIHLDIDSVLLGEVIFTPLSTINIFNIKIPIVIINLLIILLINLCIFISLKKEFLLYCFDEEFCFLNKFNPKILSLLITFMIGVSSVVCFGVVGSILVTTFFIVPVSVAKLFAKTYNDLIYLSITFSLFNVIIGYLLSILFNVNISGMIAFVSGIMYILFFFFKNVLK